MSAVACSTCHRLIDNETDMCLGCGKKFQAFRIETVCTHCEGRGGWDSGENGDDWTICHVCKGTCRLLFTDSSLKKCQDCNGNGYEEKDKGWFFRKMTLCECKTCGGHGVLKH